MPFVQDGEKAYRFTVRWGIETDTDDSDGSVAAQSDTRPAADGILALLPRFTGTIEQTPPAYSAVKINGERAYDLARGGEAPVLSPRPVTIYALDLIDAGRDEAVFEARCGKGTYVRAIARDLGREPWLLWPCLRLAAHAGRAILRNGRSDFAGVGGSRLLRRGLAPCRSRSHGTALRRGQFRCRGETPARSTIAIARQ